MVTRQGAARIADQRDDARVAAFLQKQRLWAAYALCDLDDPYRPHARFIGAERDGELTAVVLAYTPPGFTALVPCGDVLDTLEILKRADGLPAAATLLSRWEHRAAFEARYVLTQVVPTQRMAVTAGALVPAAAAVSADIVALSEQDIPRMERLYALWPDAVFTASMFAAGFYFGAERAGELVAVAGSHAFSKRYAIGVVGNVFTHVDHRGRGLGSAVTAAVVSAMVAAGAHDVALNVRQDNTPALAMYRQLGFTAHTAFFEATALMR